MFLLSRWITRAITLCAFIPAFLFGQTPAGGIRQHITGTVLDETGHPIPGAIITLQVSKKLHNRTAAERRGVASPSNQHGRFAVELSVTDSQVNSPKTLKVYARGYREFEQEIEANTSHTAIQMEKGEPFCAKLRILTPAGRPVPKAKVTLSTRDSLLIETIPVSKKGIFRLCRNKGEGNLFGEIQTEYGTFSFYPSAVPIPDGDIRLRAPIRGTLLDDTGAPIPNTAIYSTGFFGSAGEYFCDDSVPHNATPVARTDKDGRFLYLPNSEIFIGSPSISTPNSVALRTAPIKNTEVKAVIPRTVLDSNNPHITLRTQKLYQLVQSIRFPIRRKRLAIGGVLISLYQFNEFSRQWHVYASQFRYDRSSDTTMRTYHTLVPSGHYKLVVDGLGTSLFAKDSSREIVVDTTSITLPPLELQLSVNAKSEDHLAPVLSARTILGEQRSLADYRGNVIILDFWGYWCSPCLAKLPPLIALQREYTNKHIPVKIIALHDASIHNKQEFDSVVVPVLKHSQLLPFPLEILIDNYFSSSRDTPLEERDHFGISTRNFTVKEFPTTIVINRTGKVQGVAQNEKDLEDLVNQALQEEDK